MTIRDRLFALEQFGIKLGLDNIRALLAALDHPERAFPSAHIAGTNGKGSVAAMVEHGLRAAGHRTGRYTSPHLAAVEERFAVNGLAIDPAVFDAVAADVFHAVDGALASGALRVTPTFFEVTTAIGLEAFRRDGVGAGVIEVGLGGRFDATNAIEPLATAITSIAFDHERHLGTTLSAIAFEKAGIAKSGVPLVVGPMPEEAATTIARVARDSGAPLMAVDRDSRVTIEMERGVATIAIRTPVREYPPVRLALPGRHQAANALVAVRLLETLDARGLAAGPDAIVEGLAGAVWPARLEWLRPRGGGALLIDAAHNPSGAAALASYIEESGVGPLPMVMAAMQDKNVGAMVQALAPAVSSWIATQAPSRRSRTADELARQIVTLTGNAGSVRAVPDSMEAVRAALSDAPRAVAAGSIYMVGPLRAALLAEGAMLSSSGVMR